MFLPMTLNDLESLAARNQISRRISLITLVPFDVDDKTQQDNTSGEQGVFPGVGHVPTARGRAPALHNFWILSRIHCLKQNYLTWPSNTHGEGLVFRRSAKRPPQGGGQHHTIFGFLYIYVYTI